MNRSPKPTPKNDARSGGGPRPLLEVAESGLVPPGRAKGRELLEGPLNVRDMYIRILCVCICIYIYVCVYIYSVYSMDKDYINRFGFYTMTGFCDGGLRHAMYSGILESQTDRKRYLSVSAAENCRYVLSLSYG